MESYKQLSLFEFKDELGLEEKKEETPPYQQYFWKKRTGEFDFDDRKYYFRSTATNEYVFSISNKTTGERYLCFYTDNMILVNMCGIKDENDLLKGKEPVIWPAMEIGFYDGKGNKKTDIHYADDDSDDRQKWIVGVWHMDKVSHNRLEEGKTAKDFCELEFSLPDYIEWLKNDIKTRDYTK